MSGGRSAAGNQDRGWDGSAGGHRYDRLSARPHADSAEGAAGAAAARMGDNDVYQSWTDPADFGLTPGSKPVRRIKPRTGRKTMPGWFPTRKGVDGSIRTETTLEMRGLAHFEVNPDVVLMAGQPHHLVFWEPKGHRKPQKHVYTPDVALLMRDGRVAVIDFKATRFRQIPKWKALEDLIERAYLVHHGIVYTVRTELEIGVEPRASNVAQMLTSRPTVPDDGAAMAVRSAIAAVGLPATVGVICRLADVPSDDPKVDRAFAAIVAMALAGDVEMEMGRPFGDDTLVSERRRQVARRRSDAA